MLPTSCFPPAMLTALFGGTPPLEPVAAKDFYGALEKNDLSAVKTWMGNHQLGDALLRSPHPDSGDPLFPYLAKYKTHSYETFVTLAHLRPAVPADVIDARDEEGNTALLHLAKGCCDMGLMKALLDAGADPNARDSEGRTVLMNCVRNDEAADQVRLLCRHGADVNLKDHDGCAALHFAMTRSAYSRMVLLPILLAAGADKHAVNQDGKTCAALIVLVPDGDHEQVRETLAQDKAELVAAIKTTYGRAFAQDLSGPGNRLPRATADTAAYGTFPALRDSAALSEVIMDIRDNEITAPFDGTDVPERDCLSRFMRHLKG